MDKNIDQFQNNNFWNNDNLPDITDILDDPQDIERKIEALEQENISLQQQIDSWTQDMENIQQRIDNNKTGLESDFDQVATLYNSGVPISTITDAMNILQARLDIEERFLYGDPNNPNSRGYRGEYFDKKTQIGQNQLANQKAGGLNPTTYYQTKIKPIELQMKVFEDKLATETDLLNQRNLKEQSIEDNQAKIQENLQQIEEFKQQLQDMQNGNPNPQTTGPAPTPTVSNQTVIDQTTQNQTVEVAGAKDFLQKIGDKFNITPPSTVDEANILLNQKFQENNDQYNDYFNAYTANGADKQALIDQYGASPFSRYNLNVVPVQNLLTELDKYKNDNNSYYFQDQDIQDVQDVQNQDVQDQTVEIAGAKDFLQKIGDQLNITPPSTINDAKIFLDNKFQEVDADYKKYWV